MLKSPTTTTMRVAGQQQDHTCVYCNGQSRSPRHQKPTLRIMRGQEQEPQAISPRRPQDPRAQESK
eukprot:9354641-Pyramimonas_sp.AAC.1